MKIKKFAHQIVAFAVSVAMVLTSISVLALYDVDHSQIVGGNDKTSFPYSNDSDFTGNGVYSQGKFTINEKDFVLLDKDDDGNYFVISADTYGRYVYHNDDLTAEFGNKQPLVTARQSSDGWVFDDSPAKSFKDNRDWIFDTENPDSIGYWLNNDFLTYGNTTGGVNYKLPDEIQNHLVAKPWDVESVKPLRKITANDATKAIEASNDVMKLADLRELTIDGYTTAPGKVSLLSYSEYEKYWDKLGYQLNAPSGTTWKNGILFRTPALRVENTSDGYVMSRGVAGINGQAINATTKNQIVILAFRTANDQTAHSMYYVRPVFWLDKDFFIKQKPNISGAGSDVTDEMSVVINELKDEYKRNPEQVLTRYTVDELMDIGIIPGPLGSTSATMPWITGDYIDRPVYADGKFTVEEKDFILLDTDSEGNFFVTTADMYGKHKYHNEDALSEATIGKLLPLVTAEKEGDDWTFDNSAVDTVISDAENHWFYSTTNTDSIGYWLNNDFLKNGNGDGNILPDGIKNNLVEKEWEIEAIRPLFKSSDSSAVEAIESAEKGTDGVTKKAELMKIRSDSYTVDGKVSLLSYTEYETYWNKLGYASVKAGGATAETSDTDGVLFRTPAIRVECASTGYVLRRGSFGMVKQGNYFTVDNGVGKGRQTGILAFRSTYASTTHYNIRPVFYLDKDFFKNVRVSNISNLGADVKEAITDTYKLYELSDLYSESELSDLGFDLKKYPKAENTTINGTPTVGSLVTVDYKFVSQTGKSERNTTYVWYTKSEDDQQILICETDVGQLMVSDDLMGKKICCKVYPCDTAGREGLVSIAETTRAVSDVKGLKLQSITTTKTSVNAVIKNDSIGDETVRAFVAVFDSDNILIELIPYPAQTVASGRKTTIEIASIPTSSGNAQFMIWGSDNKPIYFVNK